jgi:hypothetical protein
VGLAPDALATVGRSCGRLLDALHHVAHHPFSAIPHDHAAKAAASLRPPLGAFCRRGGRGAARALREDWRACAAPRPTRARRRACCRAARVAGRAARRGAAAAPLLSPPRRGLLRKTYLLSPVRDCHV